MKKFLVTALLAVMALTIACCALAEGRQAPADMAVIETTDVISEKTLFRKYDQSFFDSESTQPGTVVRIDYTTDVYGEPIDTWANVYLPYGYDESGTTRYDILYFMHGTNENQDSFIGEARVKNAIDNMIEVGVAEPFIMVCPTYYYDYPTRSTDHQTFVYEVRKDLMPAVESTYHTYAETADEAGFIASREHRAFSGYSQGSGVTWVLFGGMLDYAKWFLPFSGGNPSKLEGVLTALDAYSDYADDIFIYMACGGKRDAAYEGTNALMDLLIAQDAFSYGMDTSENNLCYTLSNEIHQTMMSRFYLYNAFLDVLFK